MGTQTMHAEGERVHNGHQVLDHFGLRRQAFLVNDRDGATVLLGEMLKSVESEPDQPILVGKQQVDDHSSMCSIRDRNTLRWKFRPPPMSDSQSSPATPAPRQYASMAETYLCRSVLLTAAGHSQ